MLWCLVCIIFFIASYVNGFRCHDITIAPFPPWNVPTSQRSKRKKNVKKEKCFISRIIGETAIFTWIYCSANNTKCINKQHKKEHEMVFFVNVRFCTTVAPFRFPVLWYLFASFHSFCFFFHFTNVAVFTKIYDIQPSISLPNLNFFFCLFVWINTLIPLKKKLINIGLLLVLLFLVFHAIRILNWENFCIRNAME